MLENFIICEIKDLFLQELGAGGIPDDAIVFIEETREIYTHGVYYDGSKIDLNNLEESLKNFVLENLNKTVQTIDLVKGFTWVSFYVRTSLEEVQRALGDKGVSIKTSNDGTGNTNLLSVYDPSTGVWEQNFPEFDFSLMYQIEVLEPFTIKLVGELLNPKDFLITLNPGSNYISYPSNQILDCKDALMNIPEPQEGDIFKSYSSFLEFAFGEWQGASWPLSPGQGYIYKSKSDSIKKFYFPTESDLTLKKAKEYTDFKTSTFKAQKVTQKIHLNRGWNWVSFYVDITLEDLQAALGPSGVSIKHALSGLFSNNVEGVWAGNLKTLDLTTSYLVQTSEDCDIYLSGDKLNPSNVLITLNPGPTYIPYLLSQELDINIALQNLKASEGDTIKGYSQDSLFSFLDGAWVGLVSTMQPGQGYLYTSNNSEPVSFTYPNSFYTPFGNVEVVSRLGDSTEKAASQDLVTKELSKKQAILKSGENIKTINGQSLLGSGNIEIIGGEPSVTQEYVPLKYIGNTGTQYIDTGIVLTAEDIITLDFTIPAAAVAVSTDKILIDARDTSNGVRVSTYADNKKWYARFGHNRGATSTVQSAAIRQGSLVFSKDSLIVNGVTVINSLVFTAMPAGTLKLLSGVTPEGAISGPSYARISSCKVVRDGKIILNLTPVQRVEDGAAGMRDTISGEFLANSGTGVFEYELAPVSGDVTIKKYPSLTTEQKVAMQKLMDDYYNNRSTFYYEFTHNRNAFTSGGQCYDSTRGKFKQCCATFVQHLMMGRSINDFLGKNASTYSAKITKTDVSEFGYYFDFKYRKYLYGLTDTDDSGETTYYGYIQPNADNFEGSYSYNSYYHPNSTRPKKQNFNGFVNANDMARELYEMGCEVPFSELEVGDIIFTLDPDMQDNSSMFNFVAWRNIYHVGMVYDVKQIDASSKEIYYIECTSYFDTETRPIEKPFLSSTQMDLRFKAFKLTEDMAFCARMPSVFGYEPNVPDTIAATATAQ